MLFHSYYCTVFGALWYAHIGGCSSFTCWYIACESTWQENLEKYLEDRRGMENKKAVLLWFFQTWHVEGYVDGRGVWTRRLILVVREWVERKHGETNFLILFLTDLGCFLQSLERMRSGTSFVCILFRDR